MKLPLATWKTALIVGAVLGALVALVKILASRDTAFSSPNGVPTQLLIVVGFVVSIMIFTIGVRNFTPTELRGNGLRVVLNTWGRMLVSYLAYVGIAWTLTVANSGLA